MFKELLSTEKQKSSWYNLSIRTELCRMCLQERRANDYDNNTVHRSCELFNTAKHLYYCGFLEVVHVYLKAYQEVMITHMSYSLYLFSPRLQSFILKVCLKQRFT